jgi:hypothetical protein
MDAIKPQQATGGFMLLGLDQLTSAKSKASLQFGLDQHLRSFVQTMNF